MQPCLYFGNKHCFPHLKGNCSQVVNKQEYKGTVFWFYLTCGLVTPVHHPACTICPANVLLSFIYLFILWISVSYMPLWCIFLPFGDSRSPDATWKGEREGEKSTPQKCYHQSWGTGIFKWRGAWDWWLSKTSQILEKKNLLPSLICGQVQGPCNVVRSVWFYGPTFMKMINSYWIVSRIFITVRGEQWPYIGSESRGRFLQCGAVLCVPFCHVLLYRTV